MATFVLVPSPLLGPAVWAPVADVLTRERHQAVVAHVDDVVPATTGLADLVLVPHSNAGYYAPSLAQAVSARGCVYVDAALPLGSTDDVPLAPPAFYAFLEGLVEDDGLLPPWTQWWEDLGELFPDEGTRRSIEAEQTRLPLSYFAERVAVLPGWADRPSGYLAFGGTYADEVAFAYEHGWPVIESTGQHLHQLHEPELVATAIVTLADQVVE